MEKRMHPYHLVDKSPWPIMSAITALGLASGLINMFSTKSKMLLMISMLTLMMMMYQWWRDVTRESTYQGKHTKKVTNGIKLGMLLFIFSEIMFFLSFFWTYFHSSLSPTMEIGLSWPPTSMNLFNPMEVPLLNTLILVSSGVTITWAHHSLMMKKNNTMKALMMTIILGVSFTMLQYMEYWMATFTMSDSVFGSIFFATTGMHGMHVIIGTLFMIICYMRMYKNHFTNNHHTGMELMIWYWHFVDIVWLFLYMSYYWWPSM
uniref:cytochrome c oxidase subunit 3 n=1 Tax=Austropallene cornigera TaxID=136200 RepID=UPI0022655482|nr:cytochrome c oxidase subunit 3 [Austropallene cornigera]UYX57768.1 cytochrome c oxidase subunit 3 [Austropallene cornigera]